MKVQLLDEVEINGSDIIKKKNMDDEIINAGNIRLLASVAEHGYKAAPYNLTFLEKYSLKELFLSCAETWTIKGKQKKTIEILDKNIRQCARRQLPGSLYKTDRQILAFLLDSGMFGLNQLFSGEGMRQAKMDFLKDYSLSGLYLEYMEIMSSLSVSKGDKANSYRMELDEISWRIEQRIKKLLNKPVKE